MCRLLGISYASEDSREDLSTSQIVQILFRELTGGGPHSYGWMSYNAATAGDPVIEYFKTPGRADTKQAQRTIRRRVDNDALWFVGHVRFATHGDPADIRNDHPIPHANIIGVHNGVLRNHEKILAITGREDPKTKVDSEAIFAAVNRWGPTKGLAKIQGDLVSIYTDIRKPHVLHIARTHGRQLTIGWTKKGNLIFASEEKALRKLEPQIEFVKFSTIGQNRLLIVRNGKIIQRHSFGTVIPHVPSSLPSWIPPRGEIRVQAGSNLIERRAQKRGELLFPSALDEPTSAPFVFEPFDLEPKRRRPNQNEKADKLYYYDGQLLTRREWEEALGIED